MYKHPNSPVVHHQSVHARQRRRTNRSYLKSDLPYSSTGTRNSTTTASMHHLGAEVKRPVDSAFRHPPLLAIAVILDLLLRGPARKPVIDGSGSSPLLENSMVAPASWRLLRHLGGLRLYQTTLDLFVLLAGDHVFVYRTEAALNRSAMAVFYGAIDDGNRNAVR